MSLSPSSNFATDTYASPIYGVNVKSPLVYNAFTNTLTIYGISGIVNTLVDAQGDTLATSLAIKNYIDYYVQGLEWQNYVISTFNPTSGLPPTPNDKDRYIASATANGWTINYIYEFFVDAGTWTEIIPLTGWTLWVQSLNLIQSYNVNQWVVIQGGMSTSFLQLSDTPKTYTTPNSIYTVNPASNGVAESTIQIVPVDSDSIQITHGTMSCYIKGKNNLINELTPMNIYDFWDFSTGTPTTGGERYINTVTFSPYIKNHIYELVGTSWNDMTYNGPDMGDMVFVSNLGYYVIFLTNPPYAVNPSLYNTNWYELSRTIKHELLNFADSLGAYTPVNTHRQIDTYIANNSNMPTGPTSSLQYNSGSNSFTGSIQYVIDNSNINASKLKIVSPNGTKIIQLTSDQLNNTGQLYNTSQNLELWTNSYKFITLQPNGIIRLDNGLANTTIQLDVNSILQFQDSNFNVAPSTNGITFYKPGKTYAGDITLDTTSGNLKVECLTANINLNVNDKVIISNNLDVVNGTVTPKLIKYISTNTNAYIYENASADELRLSSSGYYNGSVWVDMSSVIDTTEIVLNDQEFDVNMSAITGVAPITRLQMTLNQSKFLSNYAGSSIASSALYSAGSMGVAGDCRVGGVLQLYNVNPTMIFDTYNGRLKMPTNILASLNSANIYTYTGDNSINISSGGYKNASGVYVENTYSNRSEISLLNNTGDAQLDYKVSNTSAGAYTSVMTVNKDSMMLKQTTAATNTTSGCLQLSGGLGVTGNTYSTNVTAVNGLTCQSLSFSAPDPYFNMTMSTIAGVNNVSAVSQYGDALYVSAGGVYRNGWLLNPNYKCSCVNLLNGTINYNFGYSANGSTPVTLFKMAAPSNVTTFTMASTGGGVSTITSATLPGMILSGCGNLVSIASGSTFTVANTTNATTSSSASLIVGGGLSCNKDVFLGDTGQNYGISFNGNANKLNYYNEYTSLAASNSFTSGTSTPLIDIYLSRIGKVVTACFYQSAVVPANAAITSVTPPIPIAYRPLSPHFVDLSVSVINNNAVTDGRLTIDSSGNMAFYRSYPSTVFQNNSGIGCVQCSWMII